MKCGGFKNPMGGFKNPGRGFHFVLKTSKSANANKLPD